MTKKTFSKVGVEGAYLNIIKVINEKPKANIILKELLKNPIYIATRKTKYLGIKELFLGVNRPVIIKLYNNEEN